MTETGNSKRFDLEERTFKFAKAVIGFSRILPKSIPNAELVKQLVRSSGSVGANYIEANEALSKKDFTLRVKICRKEAKESRYWLMLIEADGEETDKRKNLLINEATELMKIFGSIIEKVK
jgi:four helix bundle protein